MLAENRRLEVLAAIGIDVYRLRATDAARQAVAAPAPPPAGTGQGAQAAVRLVVACAQGAGREPAFMRLLPQLLRALGVTESTISHIETGADGSLAGLPEVSAYLMIGAAAARACSAQLSIEQQNAATIVVGPEPAQSMRDAAGKRALWQQLKPLARRLRAG